MNKLLTMTCCCLLTAGCTLREDYSRPEIDTTGLFGRGAEESAESLASLPWRELFADPCLQSLISKGLMNNSDLAAARLRLQQAQATLMASRRAFLPSLSLTPQASANRYQDAAPGYPWSLAAAASWEADIFARLANSEKQAAAAVEQGKAYQQAVQTALIASLANGYYNLLMLDAQWDITRETLATWEETLRTLRLQKEAGLATEAAVAQAAANKLAAEAEALTLQQQITTAENACCTLLGQAPARIPRTTLSQQPSPRPLLAGKPLQLLSRRPDVRQAEAALAQSFYGIQIARSAFYPQATLQGSAGWSNNTGETIANPALWLLQSTLSLAQPLFSQGKNEAQLRIARAQYEENLLAFRQSLIKAAAEVNDALAQGQTAGKRLERDAEQIAQLQKAVASSRLLLEHSGAGSYLEVLTAQQSLLQAQLTEVSDKVAQLQAVVKLYQALGGGME